MLAFVVSTACAATDFPTAAPNCALDEPPGDAGITRFLHGNLMLVHPRRSALTDRYTGCTHFWFNDKLVAKSYFVEGALTAVHIAAWDGDAAYDCFFEAGRLVEGAPAACKQVEVKYHDLPGMVGSIQLKCYLDARAKDLAAKCPKD